MKRRIFPVLLAVVPHILLHAQMSIHRSVYDSSRIDEALREAQEKKQPISIVYTDKNSNCGLCVNASEAAFENLRRFSVVIYLPSGADADRLGISPPAMSALSSPAAGRFIPKVVTTTPDMFTVLGLVTYQEIKENASNTFRSHRRKVEALMSGREPMPEKPEMQKWFLPNNRFYTGSLLEVGEQQFQLKMEGSGRTQTFDIKDFAPGTVRYLRHRAGKDSAAPPSAPAASLAGRPSPLDTWTSANNEQTLQGGFVSLEGDVLTLIDGNGQTLRFQISLLNEESQNLARAKAR